MRCWTSLVGGDTGIFCAPEGTATAAATAHLVACGGIHPDDEVVLL